MVETTFFDSGDVKITNARFISGTQTYAMNNVTSVKPFVEVPKRFWLIVVLLVGLLVMTNNVIVGLVIVAVAAAILYGQKTKYHLVLSTAGGETKALLTYDRGYLDGVMDALNQAIIHRG